MAAGPAEVVTLHKVLGQERAPVISFVTKMASVVVHTRLFVLLEKVFFQRDLSPANKITAGLLAFVHGLVDVDLHVALDAVLRLAGEITEVTPEWLLLHVLVLDVAGQSAGGGTGHITVGALVMVNVGSHVVPQESLQRKLFSTIIALKRVFIRDLLPLTVIQKLYPARSKQSTHIISLISGHLFEKRAPHVGHPIIFSPV